MERKTTSKTEEILAPYAKYIRNVVGKYLKNPCDAEDAAQETLLKVFMNLGSFRGESRLSTWVFSVARNTALNHLRSQGQEPGLFPDDLTDPSITLAADTGDLELGYMEALRTVLSDAERRAFFLGAIVGLDSRKGGEVLALTPEGFRQRVCRARHKLNAFHLEHCDPTSEAGPTCDFHVQTSKNAFLLEQVKSVLAMEEKLRTLSAEEIRKMLPL